jgi:hypothetical protein
MRLAWAGSCVTHKTPRPAPIRDDMSASTAVAEAASRAAVGSSSNEIFGRMMRARISASRSRSPVDKRLIRQVFVSSLSRGVQERQRPLSIRQSDCRPSPPNSRAPLAHNRQGGAILVGKSSPGCGLPGRPSPRWGQRPQWLAAGAFCHRLRDPGWRRTPRSTSRTKWA